MRIKEHTVLPRILSTLVNGLVTVATSGHTSKSVYKAFREFDRLQELSARQIEQSVRYAIDKKYIVITKDKGKTNLLLSAKGKKLAGKAALEALKPNLLKVWDRLYRIILFDIPEDNKSNRDGFAAGLKRMGLVQIQKSVFAFPYPCFEELEVLAGYHGVDDFVTYIEAMTLQPHKAFHKHFTLQN